MFVDERVVELGIDVVFVEVIVDDMIVEVLVVEWLVELGIEVVFVDEKIVELGLDVVFVVVEIDVLVDVVEVVLELGGALDSGESPVLCEIFEDQKWSESRLPYAQCGTDVLTLIGPK